MADTKISALPVGAAIDGTELLVAVQSGADVQTTPADLLTYVNANASLDAARITGGTLVASRGGTGVSNADANTLTLGGATSITGGGTLALGGFTLTVPATGSAALLAVANIFTNTQTIRDSNNALGITLAGANTGGTPAIATSAPAQVASATAGTPLSITASAAVAGSSNAGAAAGGAITITSGAAARLTSGNANGGDINLTPGAGIGTGTAGAVVVAVANNTTAALKFSTHQTGFTGQGNILQLFTNNPNSGAFNFATGAGLTASDTHKIGFGSITGPSSTQDTAIARNAAGILEVNNGTAGQWGSIKAGTRDAGTNTTSVGLTLGHQSTGTPAAGLGIGIKLALNSDTTADQDAAQIEALWTTATHATRTSNLVFSLVNSAAALAEVARLTPTQAIFPAGSSTVPGVTFIGNTTDGIARVGGMSILAGGSLIATFASNRSQFNSGAALAWGNGNSSAAIDTTLRRNAAGVLEIGTDANNAGRWGSLKAGTYDAGTTTVADGLTLGHRSSGTPAAGLGTGLLLNIDSTTTPDQNALRITAEWATATHASRKALAKFQVYDTAAREGLRLEASGSAPMIGFLGANAAIQQTGGAQTATGTYGATEQDMLQKAYDALRTFGLLA